MRLGDKLTPFDSETVLDDSYPVFCDYLYIVDGRLTRSDVQGTVRDLRRDLKASEVRRFDVSARTLEG